MEQIANRIGSELVSATRPVNYDVPWTCALCGGRYYQYADEKFPSETCPKCAAEIDADTS